MTLRLAAVGYLNTLPLTWPLRGHPGFEIDFYLPSECADRLRNDYADAGLVPVIEVERQGLVTVADVGIACRGAVRSILLLSKVPFERIRTLALDASSRTSAMLARAILANRYGVEPETSVMRPDLDAMLAVADAALIIGDPALRLDPATLPYRVLDLGEAWFEWTGLPMVFAVWAGRSEPRGLRETLNVAAGTGLARMSEYVEAAADVRGIPANLARHYLTDHIVYRLGDDELRGRDRYLAEAAKIGNYAVL